MKCIIFKGIKKNLLRSGKSRGNWVEALPTVLWSLRSTPNQATREAPFGLVYGTEAVLPAEVGLPTYRQAGFDEERNDQRLMELFYASHPKEQSKLSPKWEGPYRIKRTLAPGTYELKDLDGKLISRTWHASKLCKYYV
ncbi:hypothetical protein LIER_10095 [Lithospermum erythrorhizon]|uniref:Uncharacterized protein n=1 Tax=Lithospermum erythrorhizon TaxID=34254 RepID=A0AAV3PI73_LITER